MKKDSIKKIVKYKKISLDNITAQIKEIELKIDSLRESLQTNKDYIKSLKQKKIENVLELDLQKNIIDSLHQKNRKLQEEIENLLKDAEEKKNILKEVYGQKKALEKILDKIHKNEKEIQLREEIKRADENYNNKHYHSH